jgi:predicted house-cleaning NTP pyrophosphatase (Maf/HAM1 superfamily)
MKCPVSSSQMSCQQQQSQFLGEMSGQQQNVLSAMVFIN